jgi:two-component system, chemotaxis family, response regulator Rcp1
MLSTIDAKPIQMLLVEDNPGDVRLAVEALKHTKIHNQLHVVHDGVEAMSFLHRDGPYVGFPPPNLVLLDLN